MPENSRFKDLETKKNIFSKPSPRENSRWRRDNDDTTKKINEIPRHGHHPRFDKKERRGYNRRSGSGRDFGRTERRNSSINKFTNKPPAFSVEKENFPSLSGDKDKPQSSETTHQRSADKGDIDKDVADKPDAEPVVSTKMISNTLEYYRYILNVTKESTKVEIENATNSQQKNIKNN